MKNCVFFLLLLLSISVKSQTNIDYLKEINKDIWLPFMDSYATLDVEKYKSLETEDFIRVDGNNKNLPSHKEYFDNVATWFSDMKKEGRKLTIAFRFTERFAKDGTASERGIYELKSFDANGKEVFKSYGKFHVFLRKLNEKWKIVVDYDSYENGSINEQSYLDAFQMDDFNKF